MMMSAMAMLRILDRDITWLLKAPFERRHWRALGALLTKVQPGPETLRRYVTQRGAYPWDVRVKTPAGALPVRLYSRHDLLTLNEIFCRLDYGTDAPDLIVDVGANIGLAALFWLTRNPECRVWCYEPNPQNIARLRQTLSGYETRYELVEAAVGSVGTRGRFTFDDSGRYGRLSDDLDLGAETVVPVLALGEELARVERHEGRPIELVKIDTEGSEPELLASLPAGAPPVLWEDNGRVKRTDGPRRGSS
jgi:FkbM family methyltransferase